MAPKARLSTFNGVTRLPDALWSGPTLWRDVANFSVESVDRYRGPRVSSQLTAHGYVEIVAVMGGQGQLLGARPCALQQGDVVLIPVGYPHGELGNDYCDTIWIALQGSRLQPWVAPSSSAGRSMGMSPIIIRDERSCQLAELLWTQASLRSPGSGGELDGLALSLLGRLTRIADHGQAGDVMDQTVKWLDLHMDQALTVNDIADFVKVSPAHVHRLFKARTGRSPMAFVQHIRLQRAAHALRHTALPIHQVAALVGYQDPLYFSRAFRKVHGCTPSEYRDQDTPES